MWLLICWIVFGIACCYIAKNKGRNPKTWAILGFFGGIFALIAILILPSIQINNFNNNYNVQKYNPNCYNQKSIYCSNCGMKNDVNDTFCSNCETILK